mmetsp:Transcript_4054/g.9901  ORF Transcript_4054/g.9901 Transcript_4054/m.9901 type:complete len:300 (-) Transcript_4054:337-1236(-)
MVSSAAASLVIAAGTEFGIEFIIQLHNIFQVQHIVLQNCDAFLHAVLFFQQLVLLRNGCGLLRDDCLLFGLYFRDRLGEGVAALLCLRKLCSHSGRRGVRCGLLGRLLLEAEHGQLAPLGLQDGGLLEFHRAATLLLAVPLQLLHLDAQRCGFLLLFSPHFLELRQLPPFLDQGFIQRTLRTDLPLQPGPQFFEAAFQVHDLFPLRLQQCGFFRQCRFAPRALGSQLRHVDLKVARAVAKRRDFAAQFAQLALCGFRRESVLASCFLQLVLRRRNTALQLRVGFVAVAQLLRQIRVRDA